MSHICILFMKLGNKEICTPSMCNLGRSKIKNSKLVPLSNSFPFSNHPLATMNEFLPYHCLLPFN